MLELIKPTCDRKTKFSKNQQNTFGTMPGNEGGTCPGCTTGPKGCWGKLAGRIVHNCYVDKLLRCYKGIRGILEHNTRILKQATVADMTRILHAEFERFVLAEAKAEKKAGVRGSQLYYRLHWSGDVFSDGYAQALAAAMSCFPNLRFWTYTRSFWSIPILMKAPNLMLYLSLDPENYTNGLRAYFANGGAANKQLQLCYMNDVNDFEAKYAEAKFALEADRKLKQIVTGKAQPALPKTLVLTHCPVDADLLDLEFGCSECKKCIAIGGQGIWFKT